MQIDDLPEKYGLCVRYILDSLTRHGFGQEADEVARMARPERYADFAVGLESPDAGAMPGARVDNNKRTTRRVKLNRRGRDDPGKGIIDRSRQCPSVDDELRLIVQDVRRGLGQMLVILIAALAHHVEEQHATLRGIDQIFERRRKDPEIWRELTARILARWHCLHTPVRDSDCLRSRPLQRHADIARNATAEIDDLDPQLVSKGSQPTVPEFINLLGDS